MPSTRVGIVLACVACGPIGPREITGTGTAPPAPLPAPLVAAERYAPGSHLVFVDAHGQRVADLTDPPDTMSLDLHPAFSPDGRWVVFSSTRGGGRTSLWIVPVDRSGPPRRLTEGASDVMPAFSSDGSRLAFVSDRAGGLDVWVLELHDGRAGATRRITEDPADEIAPAWSARGDQIAYTAVLPVAREVRIASADGRGARRLTAGSDPAFAPGDRFVAFVDKDGMKDADLWAIDIDGQNRRRLVRDEVGDETAPCFSRDGRFVFANTVVRRDDGQALFSAIVVVDLEERPARLHALVDRLPAARVGVAVAPTKLDLTALAEAPTLYDTMLRVLLR